MTAKPVFSAVNHAIAVLLVFIASLFYNGPGHSLHWLSVCSLVLLVWLLLSIAKLDLMRLRFAWGSLPVVAIIYTAWLFVNPFVSTYPYASSITAMQLALLPLALLGWLILPNEDRQTAWRRTWRLLLLGGVALAGWGIVDFVALQQWAHGPLIDANAYAALVNLLLLPVIFSYLTLPASRGGFDNSRVLLGLIALFAIAQFMSQSRGALLALLATLPILLWLGRAAPAFRARVPWLLLALVLAYLCVKLGPFEQHRGIESLVLAPEQQMENDPAVSARLLMWKTTLHIVRDSNLFIGTGLGTFKSYYVAYREEMATSGNLAHNDYLQGLQEGGLIQLGFFLVITVLAPVWLLYTNRWRVNNRDSASYSENAVGLLLGIICVSLHAFVNFVHYVAPIALLTGLYLARGWEAVRPRGEFCLLPGGRAQIKPGFFKSLVIVLLAIPTGALLLDGIIFKVFSAKDSMLAHFDADARLTAQNIALTLRPANPLPRALLIQDLVKAAERNQSLDARARLLEHAEREAQTLATSATGLASGFYLRGKVRAMKGTPADLLLARDDLEYAVKRVPPATGMRLELIRVYLALGQEKKAYETALAAKKWIGLEADLSSLAAFAKEAQGISLNQNDPNEAQYWSWVHARLIALGIAG